MRPLSLAVLLAGALTLGACDYFATPAAEAVKVPLGEATPAAAATASGAPVNDYGATPMNERVAVIGLLNKRNNVSEEIKLKPGEAREIGAVIIRVSACERTAPWELPQQTGAFVQVFVEERAAADQPLTWRKVFSGWLFKNSPSLNVVEHPVYDVWVKDCTMRFPGEEGPAAPSPDASGKPAARPSATPAATPAPTPAPGA